MKDSLEYVTKCDSCQNMKAVPRQPVVEMTLVLCPIPFAMWGIDLVGQFMKPATKYKDVVVAVDYFIKWVEAMPLRNTAAEDIEEFICKNVITLYGIPKILVSDNGPQIDPSQLRDICKRFGIEHHFAPVCYPQANGQVEVMNRTIYQRIKKNLLESGAKWYEELPRVLWSYRTTPSNATGETPFSLVFGIEAVLPVEVCLPNIRKLCFNEEKNGEHMRECLEFTDELRDQALYRMQSKRKKQDKLNPKWEGPHKIRRVIGPGTYELEVLSGKTIKHTWHGIYLKRYYT
ncbi:hypothetical protein LIER_00510 [Lithospermum erythrorhizon]|uniref:Integrase catalytic domain-containing protein n=1 Tax=Lithospermum erythrorhizon TaxID=34254 RepID=A0AAV3NI52_LITER